MSAKCPISISTGGVAPLGGALLYSLMRSSRQSLSRALHRANGRYISSDLFLKPLFSAFLFPVPLAERDGTAEPVPFLVWGCGFACPAIAVRVFPLPSVILECRFARGPPPGVLRSGVRRRESCMLRRTSLFRSFGIADRGACRGSNDLSVRVTVPRCPRPWTRVLMAGPHCGRPIPRYRQSFPLQAPFPLDRTDEDCSPFQNRFE